MLLVTLWEHDYLKGTTLLPLQMLKMYKYVVYVKTIGLNDISVIMLQLRWFGS